MFVALATVLAVSALAARLYHPQKLSPDARRVAASDHFVAFFGNSRFEAGIDPTQVSRELSQPGRTVDAQMFTGGGWDSLHYYTLALLSRDALRPGRDAVVIEIAPDSVNDAEPGNRLGAIRPEVALRLASLPEEPVETRLDITFGAVASLYRYRAAIQGAMLEPRLDRVAQLLGRGLARLGLVGPPANREPYRLVTVPGTAYRIERVEGDPDALRAASRRSLEPKLQHIKVGGFKWTAVLRAVDALEARGIAVFLVQTPTSSWTRDVLSRTAAGPEFERLMRTAEARGIHVERAWPAALAEQKRFGDDSHMNAAAMTDCTAALSSRLSTALSW